ncbi:MAG: outer membrane protein assembly factor BamA [Verrucomicrobiales bacterium]
MRTYIYQSRVLRRRLRAARSPLPHLALWGGLRRFLTGSILIFSAGLATGNAEIIEDIQVQFAEEGLLAEEVVLANMEAAVGQAFDEGVLDKDLKRLYASGLVEKVEFLREPLRGGLRLIVVVQARAKLREILFIGNSAVSSKKLRGRILLEPNQSWDDRALEEARLEILELYAKAGFPSAGVTHSIGPAEGGYSRITFSIDEGQRAVLGRISIEGNRVFTDRQILEKMKLRERRLLKLFGKVASIDNQVLEDDLLAIEKLYRDAGYLDARITEVERRTGTASGPITLVLTIAEGVRPTVAELSVSGIEAVSPETILTKLQMQEGMPYSGKAVGEDVEFLREFYGRKGYPDLHVRPFLSSAGEGSIKLEYSVYEGATFSVGEIRITGNEETQDRVIRRELAILPGETFNTALVEASASRVRQLPNFSRVEMTPTSSSEEGYKDIHVAVTEQPTGEVAVGAGFSSIDNVVGFLRIQQSNFDLAGWPGFTGAGQKFRLNLQAGAERRDLELDFIEPWLFGKDLTLATGAYYHDILYNSDVYEERHLGGQASLRRKLGEHRSVAAGYKLDFGKVHNIDPAASDDVKALEGDFTDSMLFAEYMLTTVDSFKFPRRGHRLSLRGELSGLGGDVETYAFEIRAAKYYHLPLDTVFHLEGAFRTIDSYGGGGIPIYKREFLGGANDLRGYDYRGVGPKDEDGEPLGALSSLSGTAEISTPLPGKLGGRVRVATFLDAGTVSDRAWGVDDFYGDVGVGLRLFIIGDTPIRLDYAIPLKTDRFNDSGGRFNLQMRYEF